MNYPLQQLVIIAPILFIVLMIAFPVIGAFGGWKRAAYWGGGNFLFYVIGMLTWRFTSGGIVNLFKPLLEKLVQDADLTKIAASVAAPAFFLIILIVGNLLLLINYYIWAKRVMGLKKYKKIKKVDPKTQQSVKMKVQVQNNHSKKYKIINHVAGGVGMSLLMVPTTFGLTEMVLFTTTSASTRQNNKLANNLYNMLTDFDSKVNWFSYWGGNTAKDYDALWGGLRLKNQKIEGYKNPDGSIHEGEIDGITALENTLDGGISNIVSAAISGEATSESIIDAADNMVTSWNSIVQDESLYADVGALFSSENATEIVKQILGTETKESLDNTEVQNYLENFDIAVEEYKKGKHVDAIKVDVSEEGYQNIVNAVVSCWDFEGTEQEQSTNKEEMSKRVYQLLDILFQ